MGGRWGSSVAVVSIVAFGAGGGVYLWNESHPETGGRSDVAPDASSSAKAGGKKKSGKKGAKGGTPRAGGKKARSGGGGKPRGGGGGGGGGGGPSVYDPSPDPLAVPPRADPGNAGTDDDDDDDDDEPAPASVRRPPPFTGRGPAGQTYEAATSANKQEVTIGSQSGPDLTNAQLSGPLRNGTFVGECGASDNMKVTVKVAIKMGRPVGVSIYASDPDVAGCIDRYVRTFSWPSSPKMDSLTTTY